MPKVFLLSGMLMIFLFAGGMLMVLDAEEDEPALPASTLSTRNERKALSAPSRSSSPTYIVSTFSGIKYALSREQGFLISFDRGKSWIERNQELPKRIVHPFDNNSTKYLTAIAVDPLNEGRVAVTTAEQIFLSENYGGSWTQVPVGKPMRSSSYFTSIALSPFNRDTLLVGTSFNGFFETRDRGKSWQDPSLNVRFLYRGAGFYEEISGISYHPLEEGEIIFSTGFGHGLYSSSEGRSTWNRLDFPGDQNIEYIRGLQIRRGVAGWLMEVRTDQALWQHAFDRDQWVLQQNNYQSVDPDIFRRERIRKASGRFGIYLSSYHVSGEELDRHLDFLSRHGMNSLIVDCKDDFGWITYDTELELPRQIGAVNKRFDIDELLQKAKSRGIYVVARLVVFKDRHLYNYQDNKHAVWNIDTDSPWRYMVEKEEMETDADGKETITTRSVQREYWVDPFDPFVWQYNLAVAEELQQRGVDEIQFDYIRFPSDGYLSDITYRYQRKDMTRIDALESFLRRVRGSIHIPISTDLYGFNSWHRMGNWIGQSIEMLADYVDVISPMFYPSHFPIEFMADMDYLERARQIYKEGTTRAASIVGNRSIIRPYVQAFLIGQELEMTSLEYSRYLVEQIEGTLSAPSSGFTLWNASNRYYMVRTNLKPLIKAGTP